MRITAMASPMWYCTAPYNGSSGTLRVFCTRLLLQTAQDSLQGRPLRVEGPGENPPTTEMFLSDG